MTRSCQKLYNANCLSESFKVIRPVFFNLGSAKIFLGSAKYVNGSSIAIYIVYVLKASANRQLNKFELTFFWPNLLLG